ncbi:serine/threonine-protein kinase [Streptomyces sp. TRM49041]|uniref:serine/threonine-protein kinase n=1 Tax=Streptomyces sp. TRM49041 TaxID=2603216 RepID=UPI0011EE7619|nr:serine/threonine-protein kinase [Streptomyces sp. TRM49041]
MTGDGTRLRPLSGDDPAVLGPYRLLGRLGSGGMGRIYLARARPGGPLVAVKTLLSEGAVGGHDRRRFAREVTLAQRVDNAYTARVVDADPAAAVPWMAIEYIAAPSLAELVRTAGQLPASAIRWIAAGTAQALDALHRQGIVHRDVKPQNILLPLDGPRLIDFGISHAQDITRTSLTLGTIAFTSPEQARGEPSTAASDVYSLGATLFHLAVGRPPYPEGEDTLRLLARVSRGELDLTGLPKELVPLIRPCLAVDPSERPRPAHVLDRFLAELRRLPTSQSGTRWLPPRWTDLIGTYARQGEEWSHALGFDPQAPTGDVRTSAVPPPGPTRVDGEARARAREEERARAREEARARAQEEQRARAREEARARAQEEQRARARARASADAPPPAPPVSPAPTPAPHPPPKKSGPGSWLVLIAAALLMVFLAQSCEDRDTDTSTTDGRSGSLTRPTSTYTPRRPTPTVQDMAFRAVRTGDCLDVYADGSGRWSRRAPVRVTCGSASAYVRVTRAAGSGVCDTGSGRGRWSHYAADGRRTVLCVSRQFRSGQCFTAKLDKDERATADLMVVWNCASGRVPQGQTHILRITGYYRMPSSRRVKCTSDNSRYWYWEVNDGRSVVCAKIA